MYLYVCFPVFVSVHNCGGIQFQMERSEKLIFLEKVINNLKNDSDFQFHLEARSQSVLTVSILHTWESDELPHFHDIIVHIQTQARYIAYHSQTDSAMKHACLISMEKSIFKPPPMPFLNTGHLLSIFPKHILIIPKSAQQRFGKVTIKTCQLPG